MRAKDLLERIYSAVDVEKQMRARTTSSASEYFVRSIAARLRQPERWQKIKAVTLVML
jgi:hypothetical protein